MPNGMTSVPLWLTDELLAAIDHARGEMPRAVWVELTMRYVPAIRQARKSLGLTWKDRPRPGKRAKAKTKRSGSLAAWPPAGGLRAKRKDGEA